MITFLWCIVYYTAVHCLLYAQAHEQFFDGEQGPVWDTTECGAGRICGEDPHYSALIAR